MAASASPAQPRSRDAGRSGLGGGKGARSLHAFVVRIRAKRGHQIAAVALARKLTVLCWHLLTKETDYRWARPALVATKRRAMELRSGRPQQKGNKPGPAHAVAQWKTRPKVRGQAPSFGLFAWSWSATWPQVCVAAAGSG
jgi:hypothetical protein